MPQRGEECYLLHFSKPIGNPDSPHGQAQHYLGYSPDTVKRVQQHKAGKGARITAAAVEQGISLHLARVWSGGREKEAELKARKNSPDLCPICNPNAWNIS